MQPPHFTAGREMDETLTLLSANLFYGLFNDTDSVSDYEVELQND